MNVSLKLENLMSPRDLNFKIHFLDFFIVKDIILQWRDLLL